MQIKTVIMVINLEVSQKKLKIEMPYDLAIPLLAYIQRTPYPTTETTAHSCLQVLYSL